VLQNDALLWGMKVLQGLMQTERSSEKKRDASIHSGIPLCLLRDDIPPVNGECDACEVRGCIGAKPEGSLGNIAWFCNAAQRNHASNALAGLLICKPVFSS